jgi:ATP/ADP translocase
MLFCHLCAFYMLIDKFIPDVASLIPGTKMKPTSLFYQKKKKKKKKSKTGLKESMILLNSDPNIDFQSILYHLTINLVGQDH